ncbi:hypothetical protein [Nonomuraea sp. LPB2021202275-12-8]|uniref:hypothetical protein n=1 Tax=Nonomuraea sp. LPB2021202275-12-8 TaxID=3120159 RepID=UPI00300D26CF
MSDPGLPLAQLAHGLYDGVYCAGMPVGIIGLFGRRFAGPLGARARFLAGNAYAVYVLHALVLVAVSMAFAGVRADPLVKFAMVSAAALPLCWALASFVRSLPPARRVL